jgi:hypothetical protein
VNACEHSNEPLDAVERFFTNYELSAPLERLCFFELISGSWLRQYSCHLSKYKLFLIFQVQQKEWHSVSLVPVIIAVS